jgi:hypothetical protein
VCLSVFEMAYTKEGTYPPFMFTMNAVSGNFRLRADSTADLMQAKRQWLSAPRSQCT